MFSDAALEYLCEVIAPDARLHHPWRDIGFVDKDMSHFAFANPFETEDFEPHIKIPPEPAERSQFTIWGRKLRRWKMWPNCGVRGKFTQPHVPDLPGTRLSTARLLNTQTLMASLLADACDKRPGVVWDSLGGEPEL